MNNESKRTCVRFHPAGAVFDMDGLMLDTEGPAIPLWAAAGKPLGFDITSEAVIRTIGINEEGTRAIMMQEYGRDFPYERIRKELDRLLDETFEKHIAHKPGLIPLLDHLAALGIPLAVATSTSREKALKKLRNAGILERFSVRVCGDDITRGKPAPDIFLLAAERLGKPASSCVGFEDSPAGLAGLHAAGIRSVFVRDIIEPPPEILAAVWLRCAGLSEAIPFFI